MSLNKTLCKYFDPGNTGHVTLGPVISCGLVVILTIYSLYQGYLLISSGALFYVSNSNINIINVFFGIIGLGVFVGVLITYVITVVIKYIWNIKIATCEYKDTNKQDTEDTKDEPK